MTEQKTWPIELYGKPPFDGNFIKLTGTRADGLPDGVHTGGAFLHVDTDTVWKSLIARPYPNAEVLIETHETDILATFAGQPFFPSNWRTEIVNGRPWMVRRVATIVGQEFAFRDMERSVMYDLEQAVRKVNRAGWEINDVISLGYDHHYNNLFIVDLSSAAQVQPIHFCDDTERVHQFMRWCKFETIPELRHKASKKYHDTLMETIASKWDQEIKKIRKAVHVYASFNRPVSTLWATLPTGTMLAHEKYGNYETQTPWTWIFTPVELTKEIYDYELTWAYSPLHSKEGLS